MEKELTKDNYNYGIDFLKIAATFMIIAMHILGQGGILGSVTFGSPNYFIVWIIECFCYVGVNLYALGTGYLNAQKEVKRRAIVKRWLQVFFYTMFFVSLFSIMMPGVVSWKSWIKSALPVVFKQYWYFTQYFAVFMVMPYVNRMMKALSKDSFKRLALTIVFVLSFLPTMRQGDVFETMDGFSAIWLLGLYVIGGYFSYYKDDIVHSKKKLWLCIAVSNVVALAGKFAVDYLIHDTLSLFLINYTSVPVVLSSVAIFLLAVNMKIENGKKLIRFLGSVTFGIYLFHVNYFVWQYIFFELFAFMTPWNPILLLLGIVGFDLVIFALGGIFEFLRMKFFEVAKLNELGDWVGSKVGYWLDVLSKRIL